MFERLSKRVTRAAERRVEAMVLELIERMRAELPRGISADAGQGGVVLSGRGLKRRFALDPMLRWLRHG